MKARALMAVVAAVLTPVLGPAPPAAAAVVRDLKVLQFNIAGGAKNAGSMTVADYVVGRVLAEQPDVISLNEVCDDQYQHIRDRLNEAGYGANSHFAHTKLVALECSELVQPDGAGNAIFVRAGIEDGSATSYYFDGPDTLVDSWDGFLDRGIACVTARFEIPIRACAAHTSPEDDVASREAATIARVFGPEAERRPFILVGDLNVAPSYPSPQAPAIAVLYAPEAGGTGPFWEADMFHSGSPPRPGGAPTQGSSKIDYILASKNHFSSEVSARVEEPGECDGHPCSDHRLVWGNIQLANEPARIFQFNMCGAREVPEPACASTAPSGAAPAVISSLLDFRPDVVTLNEVCAGQFQAILTGVGSRGYAMSGEFAATRSAVARCGGQDVGNALLSRHSLAGRAVTALPDATADETYVLLCANTSLRERTVKACVTQLSKAAGSGKRQATAVAATTSGYLDADQPVILGGDFGSRPWEEPLTPLYTHHGGTGRFHELDETDHAYFASTEYSCPSSDVNCRTGEGTMPVPVALQHKLDYIFVSSHFVGFDVDATRSAVSGHVPLRGWATLSVGSGTAPPPGSGGGEPGEDLPPTVAAGPDVSGGEGATLILRGSASDPESTPSLSWSYRAGADVDAGTTCSFGSPHTATTTITCTDDGTFLATITASDGMNAPVSDTARVILANQPPRMTLTGPAAWSVYHTETTVDLRMAFSDAANDSHTCRVAWDDGSSDTYDPSGPTCNRSHTFIHAGMYTIKAAVTDDDGGIGTAEVMIVVYDPDAGFITTGASLNSPAGAVAADPEATGRGSFQFNPQYQHSDTGPEPGTGKVSFRLTNTSTTLDLEATELDWLVVTPDAKAATKGSATLNGQPGYGFVLYGYDEPDRLRIVIWPLSDGPNPTTATTYDNRPSAGYDLDMANPQPIDAGSIQTHT